MPSKAALPRNEVISDYFPMTREELGVPAVPMIRLGGTEDADHSRTVPQPHATFSADKAQRSSEFTVAARSRSNTITEPTTSPALKSLPDGAPGHDVRFVVRQKDREPSLAEMAQAAFPEGASPLLPSSSSVVVPQSRDYPYWLVALFQIVLGTMVVILVVKFANLIRESTSGPTRQVMVPNQMQTEEPLESRTATWVGSREIGNSGSEAPGYGY
ncbi:MAG: hypothetical protein JNL67_05570 [Planctomycetaceae bacterium]|nr:hypothetical protein [Planctomycetaceae bacterium]